MGLPIQPDAVFYSDIWLRCAGWLLAVLLVSELTYRFIELPARKVLNARFRKPVVPSGKMISA